MKFNVKPNETTVETKGMNGRQHHDEAPTTLSDKTRVPLGWVISLILIVIGATIWLNNSLHGIDTKMSSLDVRLAGIESNSKDRVTPTDMKVWLMKFRFENPGVKVPEF